MILDFSDWANAASPQVVLEAQGVTQPRVERGDINFTRGDESWKATNWEWFARFTDDGVENDAYVHAVARTSNHKIGNPNNAKGIVVITLTNRDDSNGVVHVGKFTTKREMLTKIESKDFESVGFKRGGSKGEKATELIKLTANFFLKGAPTISLFVDDDYSEQAPHYVFIGQNAMKNLKDSVLKNMENGSFVTLKNPAVIAATKKFLDSDACEPFDWASVEGIMSSQDRRKFAIYLVSELVYPMFVWKGIHINGFPGFKRCRYFAVPTSASTGSYDSIIVGERKEGGIGKIKVSSKSEKGARSSTIDILVNLAKAQTAGVRIQNAFLESLLAVVRGMGDRKIGRKIVYPFIIHRCLGIPTSAIPNADDLGGRLCRMSGSGSPLSTLELEKTEREVEAVFAAIKKSNGVPLVGIGQTYPIDRFPREARALFATDLKAGDWKSVSMFYSGIFCAAIDMGLNSNPVDFNPPVTWQINLMVEEFINSGMVTFVAKQSSPEKKTVFDSGKSAPKDVCRSKAWLGMRPL